MIRGTTPTHTFKVPFTIENPQAVQVVYSQEGVQKIVRQKENLTIVNNTSTNTAQVVIVLTQTETFSLNLRSPVKVQMRIVTSGGAAIASKVITVKVDECLDDNILPKQTEG